jgi:enoyl-CoA hydratase
MSAVLNRNTNNILTVTISRPEALNALNQDVIRQLGEVMEEIKENHEIKGVILTGQGDKAFVAGADIKELSALDQQSAYELSKRGQKLFDDISSCTKPIVAAINGFALGGGCELAMACHMRFATSNAKFGQPEINLGIIPGYGGTQRLTQLVGRGKALELLLSADMITAEEAKSLGLVNHVFATRDEMLDSVNQLLGKIVAKSPLTIAHIISVVNAGFGFERDGFEAEAQAFAKCAETADFREGTAAFLEKRKPAFKGI